MKKKTKKKAAPRTAEVLEIADVITAKAEENNPTPISADRLAIEVQQKLAEAGTVMLLPIAKDRPVAAVFNDNKIKVILRPGIEIEVRSSLLFPIIDRYAGKEYIPLYTKAQGDPLQLNPLINLRQDVRKLERAAKPAPTHRRA